MEAPGLVLVHNGRYTGKAGEVCQGAFKAILSRARLEFEGIDVDYAASVAYADSSADVELFEMVGEAVALHPDAHLRPIAEARGWRILE